MQVFVYDSAAYQSEIHLFRQHQVTSVESDVVDVADGARRLFRVELADAAPCYFEDGGAALMAFQTRGGYRLDELPIE